jgi:alkaline phosphatase D
MTRRTLLKATAGFSLLAAAPGVIGRASAGPTWQKDPFTLGVASGDPRPDGFTLWTRLAPEPLSAEPAAPGGVSPSGSDIRVRYELSDDQSFKTVTRSGEAIAEAQFAHSVHADISGLEPGRTYFYRFISGDAMSRVGRAKTTPAPGALLDRLRFAFASCSNYETGYFSAYRHMADENPDLVIFLGDYIYDYVEERKPVVRRHSDGVETTTLPLYRNRYAQYRMDPDLQRLHAEVPALVTWDDHEVQNDYADFRSQTFDDPIQFMRRRAAAYQAYYEHMPLSPALSKPDGASMRVYDRYTFGDLAQFCVLDGRQYRSKPACYSKPNKGRGHLESNTSCPERLEADRSMLGFAQELWLNDRLAQSKARWNVIAQDVHMAELRQQLPNGETAYWTDDWNGFPVARKRLLAHLHDAKVSNPVVLTGDIHSFFANDLKLDFADINSPTVATEFVGTSITAGAPPYDYFAKAVANNPHIKFFDNRQRGYVICDTSRERMETRYQTVSDVKDPNATLSTLKSFVVETGKAGVVSG